MTTAKPKICRTCAAALYRRNKSGLCKTCIATDPGAILRRAEGQRRAYALRPELVVACSERLRKATRTPEHAERARRMMTENRLWERGIAAAGPPGSPSRRKTAASLSNTRLAHIPPELRDEYRHLVSIKKFSAAEATAIVTEQHAKDMDRWRKQLAEAAAPQEPACQVITLHRHMPLAERAIAIVCHETGLTREDILGPRRPRRISQARWIIYNVLRCAGRSMPTIARIMKRSDHNGISHGLRETQSLCWRDPEFARLLDSVMAQCAPLIAAAKATALEVAA